MKTLERLIKTRLEWWIESQGYICEHQYGFRRGYSTQHALSHLVTDIQTTFTKNNYLMAIFVDLKDAYNSVNLQLLRARLVQANIPTTIASNIVNLYTERKIVVRSANGEFIGPRTTSRGLAQGICKWRVYRT
ncbi:Reverse transcriptase (RNA-dependent DNA polymerase) [Popillia japonica]|uniref:Reverse transcriptase (RNA-dependent DNA polymerase) n=1 Tax=Popillia japonica TaxID=7064 RepID=A0AAW1IAY4_POPJA